MFLKTHLFVLENMVHRGAEGADLKTGDGAGIMVQIPHEFILLQGIAVPEKGRYGSGLIFLPKDEESQQYILDLIERETLEMGLTLLPIRDVPTNNEQLGEVAKSAEPDIKQIFIADERTNDEIEPKKANAFVYVTNSILTSIRVDEQQKEIEELKEIVEEIKEQRNE